MKRVGRAVEFLAWAVFFALAALVLALRFWLLPDIERYREDIVAVASRAVGQPVRIGAIEGGWSGLHPRIHLTDVRIHDREGREVLVLPRVENMLSWRALLRGELALHSLVIDGLRLQVRRDAEGALHVAGMRLAGGGNGFSDWLLAQEEIVLRDAEIEWRDEQRGAPPLALGSLNLRLQNSAGEHALGLTARPPAELGAMLELRGLLRGRSLGELGAWSGRLYAELGYTDLAAWRAWVDYPWGVDSGEGALRLWLGLEGGEVTRATADLALTRVAASLGAELAPLRLASLQGRLQARVAGEAYEIAGRGLAFVLAGGLSGAPADFAVRWKPGTGGALTAETIELEPLARLAASLPFPAEARRLLAEVAPRGRLAALRVDWSGPVDAPARFTARGAFADLAAEAAGGLPGFARISGSFETNEASGRVQLDSRKSEVHLPRVFPQPRIALDTLNGQVQWERHAGQGVVVRLLSVNFANAHLSGNAYGSYAFGGEGPGVADLSAQFNRADASHIGAYLPHARLMGQATRDWLVRAIVAGQSRDVRVRLRGNLRDFPFVDPQRGEFSVAAELENGVLEYAPGWPRIRDIRARLLFERERMEIVGHSGNALGVSFADVRVDIARLADAQLTLSGRAEGATADFLSHVEASPLRGMIGGATDGMRAGGRGRLQLKLHLPLRDVRRTRVAGEFEILDNSLMVHRELPTIEHASGRISFTQSTLALHEVRGRLLGGPLALAGGTRADGGIEVTAQGRATVEGARPFFDHPLGSHFSGATDYSALLTVARGRTRFRLESALRGVASTLPAPLAKAAEDDLELRVDVVPLESGARQYTMASLGRVARAAAMRIREDDRMKLERAAVALMPAAGARVRLPQQPGILVYGALPALDLDKWLPLLARGAPGEGSTTLNVKIGALDLYGKRMHAVAFRGGIGADGWSGNVSAQELAGDIAYRVADGGRLVARLTHFRMPEAYPGAAAREPIAPQTLPSMDFAAERFDYGIRQFGRVELLAQRAGSDWRIDKLAMTSPDASFKASGVWRSGTPSLSALEFDLQASDCGELLNRLGYRGLVRGGKAQLQGSLSWIGEPTAIDYPSLAGQVKLRAEDGQFLEIEPGLGKLISLMSLQSLPRRIALDFRDVFSKGFEFERIASSGEMAGGVMALKDFRMRGSAAQVSMTGQVDLAQETQDLRVRVMPSLGDSASTVIALVNPLLAIPAAIAQKILKDPLSHIFAFDYAVSGGWADPKVEKLGVEAQAVETQ